MNIRAFALSPMVMAIGLSVGLSGCNDSNRTAQSEVTTTPQRTNLQQAYSYQLVFEDVATGAPITDELQVTLTGPAVDAGLVVDANNASVKGKTLTTSIGSFSVAANFDATNTEFSVLASGKTTGWTQTGIQVSKDSSVAGNQVLVLKLVNPKTMESVNSNADLGVAIATKTLTAPADGSITSTAVSLSTPAKSSTDDAGTSEAIGTATISLPAGVNAVDANGNKINLTGALSATTVKFGNNSASAMAAFPGGFTPTVVKADGSTDATGAFITGGFAQFNLTDSAGTPLKNFDKPIGLSIDLPKTSVNPDTGTTVAAGDTYPVWSYDEATGKWQFEANGTVSEKTPIDANNFTVSFSANHLSYWNLDYYGSTCVGNLTLNRNALDTRSLSVELVGARGLRFFRTVYGVTDSVQTFNRYPNGQSVNVIVRGENNEIVGQSTGPMNLCSAGNSININTPPVVARANLTVNVTESCPSGTNTRPSPTFVYFYDGRRWQSGYASSSSSSTDATITFNNIANGAAGTLYAFNPLTYRYDTQAVTVTAPSTTKNVNFPNMPCQVVSGSTGTGN